MSALLTCFTCGRTLESAFPPDDKQPYAGTTFLTYGHYGSTVFDPMSEFCTLQVTLCDPCLVARRERVTLVERKPTPSKFTYTSWEGPVEE